MSESVVGALADNENDFDEELEGDEKDKGASEANFYSIIGTLADPKGTAPSWAKEVVQVTRTNCGKYLINLLLLLPLLFSKSVNRDNLLSALLSCDVIIYDICQSPESVEEATWAMQAVHDNISTFTQQKVFICISTALSWARTKPLNPVSIFHIAKAICMYMYVT